MKNKAQDWDLEESTAEIIVHTKTREHVTTAIENKGEHQSHEHVDCSLFPTIQIYSNDTAHYFDADASIEVLIRVKLALSTMTHIRMHCIYKTVQKGQKPKYIVEVYKVDEIATGRVLSTVEAPVKNIQADD